MQILSRALYCPVPSAINPMVNEADDHTAAWLRKFQLLPNETAYREYRRQGFAWMVARMFPFASGDVLFALSDINTLLFLLDDRIDHQLGGGTGIGKQQELQQFVKSFLSVLIERAPILEQNDPALAALADFWERMCQLSTVFWQAKFIHSIQLTFDAAMWQLENIRQNKIPTVSSFMRYRSYLGAANIATDSIAVVTGHYGGWGKAREKVRDLTSLARNIVCWANDLYSLPKEQAHGDLYNLVLMLQHQHNWTIERALDKAMEKHDRDMARFMWKADILLHNHGTSELSTYVDALKHIIRGNVDWSENESTRYGFIA